MNRKLPPALYVTMGLPASGKTYFSERLAADLGVFFLNCDYFRLAMITKPTFKPAEHRQVFRTVNFVVEQHIVQGFGMVCNANYNQRQHRDELRNMARKHNMPCYIIWTQVPYDTAAKRIVTRDHAIPPDKLVKSPLGVLQDLSRTFQAPQKDEEVIVIDGAQPYRAQFNAFVAQLPS